MNDFKITQPLDLTKATSNTFSATAYCKSEELGQEGGLDYIVRLRSNERNHGQYCGEPVIRCHSEPQLIAMIHGMRMPQEPKEQAKHTIRSCEYQVSEVMCQRVYGGSRDNYVFDPGHELLWIPMNGVFGKLVHALEKSGEYGLAAILREGRTETLFGEKTNDD